MPLSKPQLVGDSFDHIILTDEETKEALRAGREKKFYELRKAEYGERLRQQPITPVLSPADMWKAIKSAIVIDDDNKQIVQNLCLYFSNDERFDGDLNKGLCLMGGVGVGKTTLMKMFVKNPRLSYRMEACRDVEANYASKGEEYLYRCSYNLQVAVNSDPFGHQLIGFCFDDLGTEANGKHFGKDKNVMTEILLNRYDNKLDYLSTHITTNLTANQLKEQYGSRVVDRFREMFNMITFPVDAKSRRK